MSEGLKASEDWCLRDGYPAKLLVHTRGFQLSIRGAVTAWSSLADARGFSTSSSSLRTRGDPPDMHQDPSLAHILIVGGGFGGLFPAKALGTTRAHIALIDRQNYHLFQPLLYQVATAALSPGQISQPIRALLRKQANTRVVLTEAVAVNLEKRSVSLSDSHSIDYDYLILAAGARHSYFGHDDWETLAPGLKSIDDALEIRRRILASCEEAERLALLVEDGEALRSAISPWLTFVIVGGGPTGVELAGALADIARRTLIGEYRAIDPAASRILLLEAGTRILPTLPSELSERAANTLLNLGVEVRTNARVTGLTDAAVEVGEERFLARTVIWAAGVQPSALARSLRVPLDQYGRVPVEPDLSLAGHPEVYVVGDLAVFAHGLAQPLPGLAAVAIQEGRHAAANISRDLRGERRRPFKYRNRGTLAIIGRSSAIADFGRVRIWGWFAWIAWLFIHLVTLIGLQNRLLVLVQWAWLYFRNGERSARLITGLDPRLPNGRRNATRSTRTEQSFFGPPRGARRHRRGSQTVESRYGNFLGAKQVTSFLLLYYIHEDAVLAKYWHERLRTRACFRSSRNMFPTSGGVTDSRLIWRMVQRHRLPRTNLPSG
jgi:NADH dehydrogenase